MPTSPSGRIVIDDDIGKLYEAAKTSFIYAEENERVLDLPSLVLYRDALDHLVQAAASTVQPEEDGHMALVIEHLGMIIAESVQRVTRKATKEAHRLDNRRLIRVHRKLPSRDEVRLLNGEITKATMLGRHAKGKGTAAGWVEAAKYFETAYGHASTLRTRLRDAPLRARRLVLISGSIGLVVLGSVLTVVLEALFFQT
jgi:hypothetical protein